MPVMMPERESAVAKAPVENMSRSKPATLEYRASAKAAAMEYGASAMIRRAAAVEAATSAAVETSSTFASTMPAANFGRQPAGGSFRRGRGARIDQRQRFGALVRGHRQRQHRGGRKTQATNKAAPGIGNFDHV